MYRHTLRTAVQRAGFTLVELLLVIAILGILAGTVVVAVAGQSQKAQKQRARTDITNISNALEMFELEVGRFPTASEGLDALINDPNIDKWGGPYLKGKTAPKDPWGNPYQYNPEANRGQFYDLYSLGPDGVEGTADDIGNWDEEDTSIGKKK